MASRMHAYHPEIIPLHVAIVLAQDPLGLSGGDYRVPEDALRTLASNL